MIFGAPGLGVGGDSEHDPTVVFRAVEVVAEPNSPVGLIVLPDGIGAKGGRLARDRELA
jgi:hypothetical protein